ncbi:DctP family TRAP transporter solute-binding subunit [Parathalassolituus penaei]|uniref:DctP family TRAP transporter solute-binding subunit n=1 Tax=Parathalassolituus penaei TaxID=2997323 RepID=A0A9X3EJZ5_9GAMM|nr:DctP family TRAP transporter solute-binding subunit [Parathalassolituus penaei]MCY0964003.1 DctP family TRAP transporter solute-binding subunit [Parathalassolituus penaei]
MFIATVKSCCSRLSKLAIVGMSALVLTSVCLVLPAQADEAAKPVVIRFSHIVSGKAPKGQMALKFKELAEKRLPGQVVVKVYPRAMMYEDDQVVDAILKGDLEMAAPAVSKFTKYTSSLQVYDLPFLFDDMGAVDRFQHGPAGRGLLDSLAGHGIRGLGYLHNGMKQLSANQPLLQPADAAGLKFRIMSSDVLDAQFNVIGARAEKYPFGEVFNLLETKKIDGQENTWSNNYTTHFFRVQSHITETNHGVLDYMVITSTAFWDKLPTAMRSELEAALNEAIEWGNQKAAEENAQDRERIVASGETNVMTLTPSQRMQWVQAMRPVWKQFSGVIGQDLIDAALASNNKP